jgi:uncharacterized protein YuzE
VESPLFFPIFGRQCDFSEDILVELDTKGNLVRMTIEHASSKANMADFSFKR